jgi:hypothetical protein
MLDFIKSLSLFQQILLAIAAPAFVVLLVQFIMLLFVFGDKGGEKAGPGTENPVGERPDAAGETDKPEQTAAKGFGLFKGLKLFTFRGILAFTAVWGWTALLVSVTGSPIWSVTAGILAGVLADIIHALLLKPVSKQGGGGSTESDNTDNKENGEENGAD